MKKKIFHGLTHHRLYHTWDKMLRRCEDINDKDYFRYGARGILVCDRWKSIVSFIEDMYPSFVEGLTLDRIDTNGGYSLDNCRWANKNTQSRNTVVLCSKNTSGYKGVHFDKKRNLWRATIRVGGKKKHLGHFPTAIGAGIFYDKFVIENMLEHSINGLVPTTIII